MRVSGKAIKRWLQTRTDEDFAKTLIPVEEYNKIENQRKEVSL